MKNFPASVEFVWPWRNYQGRVLSELDLHLDDNHLHIIAAPGSGKTVLGLEVVRRHVEKIRGRGAARIHKNHRWQTNPAQGESKSNVNGLHKTLRKNQSLEVTRCKIKD